MRSLRSYGPHGRGLAAIAVPLVGSQLAQFAVHATDTVMMGWYGVTGLAAMVLAGPLWFTIFVTGAGFAYAVMPLVAAAGAEDDGIQMRRVTRMGLWASLGFAVLGVFPMLHAERLFLALGQDPRIARLGGDYLSIAAWGLIPALLFMVLRSYLAALDRSRIVLWAAIASAVVNAALNWVLIFGNLGAPELGIRGAAIASLGMHCAALIFVAVYAAFAFPEHALFRRLWRPDWQALGEVFRLGWPIGLTTLSEVALFSFAAVMMGWIGPMALAAHGIALQCATATFMVHYGLSQAATVRAGRAFGRHDADDLRDGAVVAIALSIAVALATVVLFLGLPEALIGLFLDPAEPARLQIIAIGTVFLAAAALFQLADGAQVMALGLLRGMQDTRAPMVFAALSYWAIGAPAAYLLAFPLGLGGIGVWLGLFLGLAAAALLMMLRFWRYVLPGFAGSPRPVRRAPLPM